MTSKTPPSSSRTHCRPSSASSSTLRKSNETKTARKVSATATPKAANNNINSGSSATNRVKPSSSEHKKVKISLSTPISIAPVRPTFWRCEFCHSPNIARATFCRKCGENVVTSSSSTSSVSSSSFESSASSSSSSSSSSYSSSYFVRSNVLPASFSSSSCKPNMNGKWLCGNCRFPNADKRTRCAACDALPDMDKRFVINCSDPELYEPCPVCKCSTRRKFLISHVQQCYLQQPQPIKTKS
eukprot:TRINITY_DN855_c0_g1_i1.p1 TRINITY_DN855_c0_g1~~TRINITY_DN855_c0_g1_i1.p1  ORF type:complete len:242 (-),score=66.47 TRINITY_DN855_c0_g1_i1:367-1092(-)